MGMIIYSFNLNISLKMSYDVLECDIIITRAYDFIIKGFVIKGDVICARPCIYISLKLSVGEAVGVDGTALGRV